MSDEDKADTLRAYNREYKRRQRSSEEFRDKERKRAQELLHSDPERLEHKRAMGRKTYRKGMKDPEFRKRRSRISARCARKKRCNKEQG